MAPTGFQAQRVPTYLHYDSRENRMTICLDVAPADVEDLTVLVGPRRVEIAVERSGGVWERTISPPTDSHAFDGERTATYNNGVLTITLGTTVR